jgi:hypothetical protein
MILTSFLLGPVAALTLASAQSVTCTVPKLPRIDVRPTSDNLEYNFTESTGQLSKKPLDTVNPYGPNVKTAVGGLTSGKMQMIQKVVFNTETYPSQGISCVWYDTITVRIHIDPTIYIASEFPKGSCRHAAVMQHEMKHVKVDRMIVNDYSKRIGNALLAMIRREGQGLGPIRASDAKQAQNVLQHRIRTVVDAHSRQLEADRRYRQQQIDTLQEYERVSKLCPGKWSYRDDRKR